MKIGAVSKYQNKNWTWTGTILNNNEMPWCYALLNNKNNVIRRNGRHLIKTNSNFVNTENDNDMDIDVDQKQKKNIYFKPSKWAWRSGKSQENATELQEKTNYKIRWARRVTKAFPYGEYQTMKVWIAKRGCYARNKELQNSIRTKSHQSVSIFE